MTFKRLYYNRIDFSSLEDGVSPHFLCPVCRYEFDVHESFGTVFPPSFDVNQLVAFLIPNHISNDPEISENCEASNDNIELYVAVHKEPDLVALCLQRSDAEGANGITGDWWKT